MMENKSIGYLGPEGTFSNEAVLNVICENTSIKAFGDISSIFKALKEDIIDEALVPIENSTQGSVLITLDALTYYDFKIKAEYYLPIKHNLLVQKGKSLDDITIVCSHQQAIAQCRKYIESIKKEVYTMSSTANAARYVTEISSAGVIGNRSLSKKYGLDILDEDIQDYDNNVTRFILISKEDDLSITDNDKTSIIISLQEDKAGSLYQVLKIFAENNINLTKIESRPSKEGMGKYLFYIDFEGHRNQRLISDVLLKVEAIAGYFKVLGSYHQIQK